MLIWIRLQPFKGYAIYQNKFKCSIMWCWWWMQWMWWWPKIEEEGFQLPQREHVGIAKREMNSTLEVILLNKLLYWVLILVQKLGEQSWSSWQISERKSSFVATGPCARQPGWLWSLLSGTVRGVWSHFGLGEQYYYSQTKTWDKQLDPVQVRAFLATTSRFS